MERDPFRYSKRWIFNPLRLLTIVGCSSAILSSYHDGAAESPGTTIVSCGHFICRCACRNDRGKDNLVAAHRGTANTATESLSAFVHSTSCINSQGGALGCLHSHSLHASQLLCAADCIHTITMVVTSPSVTLNQTLLVSSLEMPPMLEVEMLPSVSTKNTWQSLA